jgi:hypothetical protein
LLGAVPLLFLAAVVMPAQAQKNTTITWTLSATYTDPVTGAAMTSGITSDIPGAYSGKNILSVIQGASDDAALSLPSTRWFNVTAGKQSSGATPLNFLGSDFPELFPPGVSLKGSLLMLPFIKCSGDCVFYTTLSSDLTGSNGITYHLPMTNVANSLSQGLKGYDGCPYYDASVRVEYHQANYNHNGYTKNTWIVTPMLQVLASALDTINPNCTSLTFPFLGPLPTYTGTSAAVAVLVQDQMGQSFNFGQYNIPFYFKIEQQ